MAVTISKTSTAEYMLSGGAISGCIGGGEDYRTVNNGGGTTSDTLYFRGWAGDNISDACRIISIELNNLNSRVRLTTGTVTSLSLQLKIGLWCSYGSVSGTTFNRDSGTTLGAISSYSKVDESSNWQTFSGHQSDLSYTSTSYPNLCIANKSYLGLELDFKNSNSIKLRGHLKNASITVTRTRACYITFQGDGVTTTTTTYDYGSTPSYGSTPTRTGYDFKGWKSSATSEVYTGTLPTAYEQDVTYTAQWQKQSYYIDLNGMLDGVSSGGISPYGTADVYINGSLVSSGCGDFWQSYEYGTTYEIKNIKANNGYQYDGIYSGSLSGTITATTSVVLSFSTKETIKTFADAYQVKNVYADTNIVKKIYVDTNKVFG